MSRTTKPKAKAQLSLREAGEQLRAYALSLPGAVADTPWEDDRVAKVNGKVFVFLGRAATEDGALTLGIKLPESHSAALAFPFAKEMGYGLGKSGWVSLRFTPEVAAPLDMLQEWILESYRAIAPKRVAALLDSGKADSLPRTRRRVLRGAWRKA